MFRATLLNTRAIAASPLRPQFIKSNKAFTTQSTAKAPYNVADTHRSDLSQYDRVATIADQCDRVRLFFAELFIEISFDLEKLLARASGLWGTFPINSPDVPANGQVNAVLLEEYLPNRSTDTSLV